MTLIPVKLTAVPSVLVQRRVGVGKPEASHRRSTLLPSDEVILVAEARTDGLVHWSSSARWNRTPAKFSGPLHVRAWSINTTGMLAILDNSMSLEIRQSQYQGLSCRPANIEIFAYNMFMKAICYVQRPSELPNIFLFCFNLNCEIHVYNYSQKCTSNTDYSTG